MRFQLPNGKWSDELTDPSKVSLDEAAYLVARHMYANAKATEEGLMYFGGTGFALRYIWDENIVSIPDSFFKNTARVIRKNGFVPVSNKLGKGWLVPPQFPTWNSGQSYSVLGGEPVEDDGSTTNAGPVTRLVVTQKMRDLYVAIDANNGRRPSEYSELLGWNVKGPAATLAKHGFIERKGKTKAARYHTTKKRLPLKNGKPKVVVMQPKQAEPEQEEIVFPEKVQAAMDKAARHERSIILGDVYDPTIYQLEAGLYTISNGKIVHVKVKKI